MSQCFAFTQHTRWLRITAIVSASTEAHFRLSNIPHQVLLCFISVPGNVSTEYSAGAPWVNQCQYTRDVRLSNWNSGGRYFKLTGILTWQHRWNFPICSHLPQQAYQHARFCFQFLFLKLPFVLQKSDSSSKCRMFGVNLLALWGPGFS